MAPLSLLLCIRNTFSKHLYIPNTFSEKCCFSNLFPIAGTLVVALLTLLLCIPNTFSEKCCFSNLFWGRGDSGHGSIVLASVPHCSKTPTAQGLCGDVALVDTISHQTAPEPFFLKNVVFPIFFWVVGTRVMALLSLLLCIPNTFSERCCFSTFWCITGPSLVRYSPS